MPEVNKQPIHGSFAFSFTPDLTLMKARGTWNLACACVFDSILRNRVGTGPTTRRCVIADAREWGFETPECAAQVTKTNAFLAGYYADLYIVFITGRKNSMFYRYMLDQASREFSDTHHVHYVTELSEAISWIRSENFNIPDLRDDDFPDPIATSDYPVEMTGWVC